MQVQMLDGLSGTYEDERTPLYASTGDIIDINPDWAQRLIAAGYAIAVESEPEAPKKKRVI
jgi:CRISPR/Cas system-associated exonuclease Cas4 (RecB family)